MGVGAGTHAQRIGVDSGDVALECGILIRVTDGEHGVQDQLLIALSVFLVRLAESCTDELGFRGVEVLTQRCDQVDQVLLVLSSVTSVVAVLVALPPEEACDLVRSRACRAR